MSLASPILSGTGNNYHVAYGDDKGLLVEFVEDAIHQPFESEKMGRAIYKSCAFLSIIYPGDKTKKTYRPATDEDKRRFPLQWAAYEKGEQAIENGTPITQWVYLSKSQALELKHLGFWTVELLANASDTQISGLLGGHLLRTQAKTYIDQAVDNSSLTKLVSENEGLKHANDVLLQQVSALEKRMATVEESSGQKKPGRPAKSA